LSVTGDSTFGEAGKCDSRFRSVRDALAISITSSLEVGAHLTVYVDKQCVLDLWAGHADAARTRPGRARHLVNLFSVGKAISAVCLLRLVEAERVELDAPVARYWPEFAQAGKGQVPVRFLLTHQAGLPAVARPLPPEAWSDWALMTEALAAQAPWWEPGTGHGYHVNTQGFLIGEVVRRVTGQSLGAYFRAELGGPAGLDWHWGLAPEHDARCADYILAPPSPEREAFEERARLDPMRSNAYFNPRGLSGMEVVNTRAWRAAEVPSTNGRGTARAVARLYSALATDGTARRRARAGAGDDRQRHRRAGERARHYLGAPHALRARVSAHHAPSGSSARGRAPSGTSARAARWASPIPTRGWPSAMP
jgi:CubicO group peptidase (beta-lactamase class C family)